MIVMIPIGPIASKTLSAHPMDMERNCLVACSPKRVMIGPIAVPIVLTKSFQSIVGGFAVGAGDEVVVVVGGDIFWTVQNVSLHCEVRSYGLREEGNNFFLKKRQAEDTTWPLSTLNWKSISPPRLMQLASCAVPFFAKGCALLRFFLKSKEHHFF